MNAASVHLILLGLGLAWLTVVVLVHRKTQVGWAFVILAYGLGVILLAAGIGLVPIPPVLVTP